MTNNANTDTMMSQLSIEAQKAAAVLSPLLRNADREVYREFLNMMYHYTSGSEAKLKKAAQLSANGEVTEFFEHMAQEERGHHLLAKVDLEEMDGTVTPYTPQVVQEFDKFWKSMTDQSEFLGALYVFENIASQVGQDVKDLVARLELGKLESRWLRLHAEADLEHGEEVAEMCKIYSTEKTVLAAQKAKNNWVAVFTNALTAPIPSQLTG